MAWFYLVLASLFEMAWTFHSLAGFIQSLFKLGNIGASARIRGVRAGQCQLSLAGHESYPGVHRVGRLDGNGIGGCEAVRRIEEWSNFGKRIPFWDDPAPQGRL